MKVHQTQNQSFGWSGKTHYHITSAVSQRIPSIAPYKRLLGVSSVIPDWSISNCWAGLKHQHLYFGEKLLSYDLVTQNASDCYFDFLSKALFYLRNDNNVAGLYNAGVALHFLQDVTCPLHTKKEHLKLSSLLRHKKYEGLAKKEKPFIDDIVLSTKNIKDINFRDSFVDAYQKSSSAQNPYEISGKELTMHIRESLTNACEHTFQFLEKISKLKDVPANKKEEVFRKNTLETFSL